ncbi:hypothetical protein ABVT39_000296 [Epinephelus coioides]
MEALLLPSGNVETFSAGKRLCGLSLSCRIISSGVFYQDAEHDDFSLRNMTMTNRLPVDGSPRFPSPV